MNPVPEPILDITLGSLGWAPSLPAVALLVLLTAVVVQAMGRAWRRLGEARATPARRWAVALLNVTALLAMAALLAPPTREQAATGSALLLTEGAEPSSPAVGAVFAMPGAISADEPGTQRLRVPGQLVLRRPDLQALEVRGYGLDEGGWAAFPDSLRLDFAPSPLAGVVQPAWPRFLAPGEVLRVSGTLRLPDPGSVAELRLVDPAGLVVAGVPARSGQSFALETVPRAAGALGYRLEVVAGESRIGDEPVTVHVREGAGARLLVLQSAPSFETRQLAAWAGDRGNPLVMLTRISQDRDLRQGVNLEESDSLDLGAGLLARSDFALVDGRRWADADVETRGLLLNAVREGLGLLILADEALAEHLSRENEEAFAGLALTPAPDPDPAWPLLDGAPSEQSLPMAPWRLSGDAFETLTRDERGRRLEVARDLGAGRLAVSVLRERHRWATSGQRSDFTRYWAHLMRALGRPVPTPRWRAPDQGDLPEAGRRELVCASPGDGLRLRVSTLDSGTVTGEAALVAHGSGAPLDCGSWWPAATGWFRLELLSTEGETLDLMLRHVEKPESWRTARRERRQAATAARAAGPPGTTAAPRMLSIPVSPWWAWTVLLLSGGALWIERRLADWR